MKKPFLVTAVILTLLSCNSTTEDSKDEIEDTSSFAYKIAYNVWENQETDDYEVYVMDWNGENKRNITNLKGVEWAYQSYKDKIYFISDKDTCHRCYFLYEMDGEGKGIKKISNVQLRDSWFGSRKAGTEFIINPHKSIDSTFYIVNNQGDILRKIYTGLAYSSDPMFSPTGEDVVFRGANKKFKKENGFVDELYIIDENGNNLHQITTYPKTDTTSQWWEYHAGPPHWDSVSNRIFYNSVQKGISTIFSINPDGSDLKQITPDSLSADWHQVSKDGMWLVFSGQKNRGQNVTGYDIFLMNLSTSKIQNLTNSSLYNQGPVFVRVADLPKK